VNLVALPAAVGLTMLAEPIAAVLFFRGAFSGVEVKATAVALQGYAVGLWAVAVTRLLSTCLYALQDTRTPVMAGIVAFVAKVIFCLLLMGEVTTSVDARMLACVFASLSTALAVVDWGSAGLAFATSLSAVASLLVQAGILSRRLKMFPWTAWVSSLAWSVIASVAMAVPLWWIVQQVDWVNPGTPFMVRVNVLMLAILIGIGSYLAVAWRGGKEEFRWVTAMLPQRLLRLLPQFLQPSR
jgi:putative peptidoglycan lipid II flippase